MRNAITESNLTSLSRGVGFSRARVRTKRDLRELSLCFFLHSPWEVWLSKRTLEAISTGSLLWLFESLGQRTGIFAALALSIRPGIRGPENIPGKPVGGGARSKGCFQPITGQAATAEPQDARWGEKRRPAAGSPAIHWLADRMAARQAVARSRSLALKARAAVRGNARAGIGGGYRPGDTR
ncbi:MAG: hypothetical protein KME26_25230 [Oscillatoria princeps RMCB-10]|jgi:hypothetical protein|nr:hypothetical protein [Oscillatoria princeps RMCB-10]